MIMIWLNIMLQQLRVLQKINKSEINMEWEHTQHTN